jgi:hypothetical protein
MRFFVCLGGRAVAAAYVVDRILAEFSAAAVVFAKAVKVPLGSSDENPAGISFDRFLQAIQGIVGDHRSDLLPFLARRIEASHSSFFWTGPELQILPRTPDNLRVLELMGDGEILDFPDHPIYPQDVEDSLPPSLPPVRKRHREKDAVLERQGKRQH